jgi:dTDP-glucose 4,6-dehydratase
VAIVSDSERMRPTGSEVEHLWADNTRARTLAGWTPRYGGRDGFARGLRETIAWFSVADNLRRYRSGLYNI